MIRVQTYDSVPRRIQAGPIDPGAPRGAIQDVRGTAQDSLLADVLAAGKQLTGIGIQEYVKDETTRVSQSLLGMQQELNAERDRYMAENKGQDAIGAGQHFEQFARAAVQRRLQDDKFSGRFAEMFMKQAAGAALHFTEQGQAYGRQQKSAWEESVLQGDMEEFRKLVAQNYDNPELIEFSREALRQRIEGMRPGMDNRALFSRRVQESRTIRRRIKADNRRRMGEDPEAARTPLPAAPDKAAWMEARRQAQDNLRDRLETDSLAMLADEVAFGVIEADDATRAVTRQGTRPGTPAGEMWRLVMQFKSFPIAYMQRILGGRRWIRGERQQGLTYGWTARSVGQGLGRDIPGVVCFAIISLALGYASQTLNDFVRGKTPRDPRKGETWAAAAARSGGLGIYGDFLFGKLNRYGNTAVETLAGPVATSMLNAAFAIPGHALRGDWEAAGKDAAAIALNNAPFVNFWMTRGVLEWAFLYHVRESLSPGVLRRMERQAQKEYGQRYFVSPTQDRLRPW